MSQKFVTECVFKISSKMAGLFASSKKLVDVFKDTTPAKAIVHADFHSYSVAAVVPCNSIDRFEYGTVDQSVLSTPQSGDDVKVRYGTVDGTAGCWSASSVHTFDKQNQVYDYAAFYEMHNRGISGIVIHKDNLAAISEFVRATAASLFYVGVTRHGTLIVGTMPIQATGDYAPCLLTLQGRNDIEAPDEASASLAAMCGSIYARLSASLKAARSKKLVSVVPIDVKRRMELNPTAQIEKGQIAAMRIRVCEISEKSAKVCMVDASDKDVSKPFAIPLSVLQTRDGISYSEWAKEQAALRAAAVGH